MFDFPCVENYEHYNMNNNHINQHLYSFLK